MIWTVYFRLIALLGESLVCVHLISAYMIRSVYFGRKRETESTTYGKLKSACTYLIYLALLTVGGTILQHVYSYVHALFTGSSVRNPCV